MRIDVYELLNKCPNQFATAFRPPFSRINIIRLAASFLLIAAGGMVQAVTPVVNAPATQNVERETYLVFNSTNSNLISIIDADNHNQTVTITVTNGSFFMEDVTGLTPVAPATFTGTGQQEITAGTPVSFSGSLANVNAALSESSFYPTDGYAGPASVKIDTEDTNGDTDTESISITVLAGTDTDGDGIYDHKDLDDDNDGIPDNVENPCEKTFAFNLSSEGWFTINKNDINDAASNGPETPASHSSDARTQNVNDPDGEGGLPGCAINNTGRANKNIAGASPTRTHYIVDADDSGGDMYIRSPNLGGIDYSTLLDGTFQYDAYNYRVGAVGPPINNGNASQSWSNGGQATVFIYDTNGNHVRAQTTISTTHKNRWENGLWNTFSFPLTSSGNVWQEGTLSTVLSSVSYISIRMEFIYGGNTNECDDVEYYAMDNVVLTSQASCDDDIDNDGIPNYLDLDSDGDGIFDAVEAGHGQPHTNGVVNGPVGTDGIPDAVQGQGNGNTGGATYPPALDLDGDNSSGASGANYQTTFVQGDPFQLIADSDATLYDGSLEEITVTLTNRPDNTQEGLSLNGSHPNLTGTYTSSNGKLVIAPTVSGNNVPVAEFLAALKQVGYTNTSTTPSTTDRIVEVIANDGTNESNLGTTTVTVKSTNTDPMVTVPGSQTINEDNPLTFDTGNLISILDTDGDDQTVNVVVSNGTLTLSGTTGLTVSAGSDGSAAMTFSGSQTDINAALNGAVFNPTLNFNGAASVEVTTNDGSVTDTKTVAITVNALNDAPVVSVPDATTNPQSTNEDTNLTFGSTNGNSLTITDAEGDNQTVTLTVTDGTFALSGDSGLTGLTGDGTGAINFTGSLTDVNNALANATFTPDVDFNGTATLTLATDDGNGGTNSETFDIAVNAQNDAPVVSVPDAVANPQSTNEDTPLTFASGTNSISINDVDNDDQTVTITITDGTFSLSQTTNLTGLTGNGTGSVSFTGSLVDVNAALADAIFTPTANFNGTATVKIDTDDSNGGTDSEDISIAVNAVDDHPVVDLDQDDDKTTGGNYQATFTEGGIGTAIADNDASLDNPDGPNLSSLTVTLTNRPDGDANEGLTVNGSLLGGITAGAYDPATGVLTLSGSATVVNYLDALKKIVYTNTSGDPDGTTDRLITVVANDGAKASDPVTTQLTVVPVNTAPVVYLNGTNTTKYETTFTEDGGPVAVADASAATITDPDHASLTQLVVTLTNINDAGAELLTVDNLPASLSSNYDPATGFLKITNADASNPASVADYQAALRGLRYENTAQNPTVGKRTIEVLTTDGVGSNPAVVSEMTVVPVNDPPTATDKTLTTDEDVVKVIATPDLGYNDSESNPLSKITLTAVPDPAEGVLFVDEDKNGLLDNGETALATNDEVTKAQLDDDKLTFLPATDANGSARAAFSFRVNDGTNDADNANTITFNVDAVNDAPVNTLPTAAQSIDEEGTLVLSGANAITSSDDAGTDPIVVTLSVTNGTLTVASGSEGIAANNGTGTVTLTGTVVQINTALDGLAYTGSSDYNGSEELTITTNDQGNSGSGGTLSDQDILMITVNALNDAPVVSAPTNPQSTDEDTPLTFSATNSSLISISDADDDDQTVTVTVTDGTFKLSADNGLTGLTGDGTGAVSFKGNLADIQAALADATFTPDAEFNGTATVTVVADDGNPANNTDTQSFDVTVNATNDAPTADNAAVTTYADETYAFADTDFTADYADEENNSFAGITVVSLPNAGEGTLTLNGNPVTIGTAVSQSDLASGALEFAPAAGQIGNPLATFPFRVTDSEGASSADYTMNVAVKARPTSADATLTTQEDTELTFTDTDFAFSDAADAFAGVVITQLPALGTLSYDGTPVNATDVTSSTLFTDRSKFTYLAAPHDNGAGYATIGFRVQDAAGDQSLPHTLTVDVMAVNDAPTVSNVPKATKTNQAVNFAPADFIDQFDDEEEDPLAEIQITSLPPATEGTLTLDGQPVTVNTPIPAISLSKLLFTPATGFTGTSSFGWNASDGTAYAATDAQIQVVVNEQHAPVVSNVPKASAEGDTVRFAAADFTAAYTDADTDPLQTVKITSLPVATAGTLFLDGIAVAIGDEIAVTDVAQLTFVPALGFAGTATFGWNGFDGTAYAADESTVTLTINAAPDVTPVPLTVTTGTTYFGTLADQVADPEGHTLTFSTTPTTDVAHGTLTLNEDGSFIYVPEVGYTGEDSFTYTVCDDGSPSACTTGMATMTVGTTDAPDSDSDNDGIPDAVEIGSDPDNPIDSDGDGTPDYQDTDSDNDGIPDSQEAGSSPAAPTDTDDDGVPDYQDTDSDGDGIPDAIEAGSDPTTPQDTDGDGIPDHLDQDADGDGVPDAAEVGADPANPTDSDGDGIPDYRDPDNTPEPPTDDLVIYEGFSPNDDNTNETWEIAGIENYPNNTVQIYNRWGNLLFEVQGYNNRDKAWGSDSSIGLILGSKNVPDGTYFYLIDLGDGSPVRKGFITVHR